MIRLTTILQSEKREIPAVFHRFHPVYASLLVFCSYDKMDSGSSPE